MPLHFPSCNCSSILYSLSDHLIFDPGLNMSSSNETGVYGLSDKKILEKWKADLHGQIFARELSDEVEQSLLDTALKQLHEDRDRLDIEAKADGHPEKLSCLVNSGEMEIIAYRLHHPLKTSMTTGIWAGITLGYDIFGETAINVGSYTCLDGFKDRLQEVLVNDVLSKCITEGPINGFNKDNHFREDLTNSIREKSLPGFEASASSIIDALSCNAHILSKAGSFAKIEHLRVKATDIELCDLEGVESDQPVPSIALSLRLVWLDDNDDIAHRLPKFTIVMSRSERGLWNIDDQTEP